MYGIVANVVSDRALRTGACVWIAFCNGDAECPIALGLNKSGRPIRKYTHYKRLTNFRAAWIPEHMRELVWWQWESKDDAAKFAAALGETWANVRAFDRTGRLVKDGISANAALSRRR